MFSFMSLLVKYKSVFNLYTAAHYRYQLLRFSPISNFLTFFHLPGGYYLTSVYASLHLIQSLDQDKPFSSCLMPEAQEALKEWSCRRSQEAQRQKENRHSQVGARCFIIALLHHRNSASVVCLFALC